MKRDPRQGAVYLALLRDGAARRKELEMPDNCTDASRRYESRASNKTGLPALPVPILNGDYTAGDMRVYAKAYSRAAVAAERERCAGIARNGCLVYPDGGSPTEEEATLCDEIARRILGGAE